MTDIEPVRDFIRREFLFDKHADLGDDTVLFPDLVDSLGIMSVVEFIEERYDVTIPDDELEADHFASLASIRSLIEAKQAKQG